MGRQMGVITERFHRHDRAGQGEKGVGGASGLHHEEREMLATPADEGEETCRRNEQTGRRLGHGHDTAIYRNPAVL